MSETEVTEDAALKKTPPQKAERELTPYMVVLAGQDRVVFAEDEEDLKRRIAKLTQ